MIFQPGRDQKTIVTGTIHPYRGEWIEFDVEAKPNRDVTAGARVARKRRLSLFVVLRALGYEDEAFLNRFVRHFDFLEGQWEKERELDPDAGRGAARDLQASPSGRAALARGRPRLLRERLLQPAPLRPHPGRPLQAEPQARPGDRAHLRSCSTSTSSVPTSTQGVLSPSEVLAASTYMLHLANGEAGYRLDDQDHFANRRIRSVGELIQNQVRIGLSRMERVVRERMTTQDVEAITPQTLINIRPVVAAIKEFFGTSQLSQFMDQHNPLSGLAHKRRLSALGPGGLSRERAGFEVRDVHTSHYGRMCPIETPEGPNIGLIGHLASYARVNDHGFIETPYRKVVDGTVTDEIVYLAADEEEEYVIAQASAVLDAAGQLRRRPRPRSPRPARRRRARGRDVDLLRHHERGRLRPAGRSRPDGRLAEADPLGLDGAHPLRRARRRQPRPHGRQHAEAGRPAARARGALHRHRHRGPGRPRRRRGHRSPRAPARSSRSPATTSPSSTRPGEKDRLGQELGRQGLPGREVPPLQPEHLRQPEAASSPRARRSALGDVLADGPSTHNGELALGKNLLVAFMPWEGYNYEDAIILSERLVRDDVLTSIHIEEHEVDARDTKLGAEEITRDIPNLSDDILADLDERGIIRIGAEVDAGRHPRRQGHPEGRDRAHSRRAAAAGDLRREGPRRA